MASYGQMLARKAPKPDAMEALGEEPDNPGPAEEEDEDANNAAAASAFDDFAKAAGFKGSSAAYRAFKEAVHACMKG